MVMTYSHAKFEVNGQSVTKTEWKQTDRQTDEQTDRWTEAIELPPWLMRSVKIKLSLSAD